MVEKVRILARNDETDHAELENVQIYIGATACTPSPLGTFTGDLDSEDIWLEVDCSVEGSSVKVENPAADGTLTFCGIKVIKYDTPLVAQE